MTAFLYIYCVDSASWRVTLDDESAIDAAVTRWLDSGHTRDTLLTLTAAGGDEVKLRASQIASWSPSTPSTRAKERALDDALANERKADKPAWQDDE